jgi:hypothetical protein
MALSNWDTLSFDYSGKSTNGVFTSPISGVSVEIYKNWAHISDPKSWRRSSQFTKPIVGSINEGEITYKDLIINAKRGKQNGIYILVDISKYSTEKEKLPRQRMIGIGCYGYKTRIKEYLERYEGITNVKENEWDNYGIGTKNGWHDILIKTNPKTGSPILDNNGKRIEYKVKKSFELTLWTGVQQETINDMKRWIRRKLSIDKFNKEEQNWFDSIDWNALNRHNQGDAFFSENLDIPLSETKVGESEMPTMTKIINNIKHTRFVSTAPHWLTCTDNCPACLSERLKNYKEE